MTIRRRNPKLTKVSVDISNTMRDDGSRVKEQ